jgi:hypothetical protein
MKLIKIAGFSVIALLAFTKSASADGKMLGFYIEPGLTYETGNWTASFPAPFNNTSGTTQGFGLELKGGLHFAEIFFAGLDAMGSQPTFNNPGNSYNAPSTETSLGVIAGLQMPITGLRAWAGYLFSGTLDPQASNGTDFKFQNGTGYKLGVGFQITMISLNLEYIAMNYPQTVLQSVGPFSTNATLNNTTLANSSFVFSVSVPLTL